ncbi:tetratricopeptide repeat-containing sensor histidine kinase [Rudanella lutea]|uniref:tetratricopeptide repeat-containing sensor histidine kinase n=1 Tax=Rudanella lutea TaxID=451374 RepID=UPI0003782D58|nr:sensor histidine kinase [Rudanella lutea]
MDRVLWLYLGLMLSAGQALGRADSVRIDSVKRAINRFLGDKQYARAAQSYEQLGYLYHQQFGYNKYTMDAYFNGLKYYSLAGDSLGYYQQHLVIGDYYTHDYFMQSSAEKYLTKALQYFRRVRNLPKIIECRLGLANIDQKKVPIPAGLATRLREVEQLSAANKQTYFQAFAQNLLANTYSQLKKPDSAQYYASRSLILAKQLNINWLIALNHFYLGIVEQFKNNPQAALKAYEQSVTLARSENNVGMLRELAKHSATSYSSMGNYKQAYEASLRALDFADEFYLSEQTKSIRLQELDSQIKTLEIEKQLVEQQSAHQRLLNTTLAIILIISVLGVVALIFLRRQQKLIAHQQSVIAQQQIRQLELKSLRAMIEGQEGERSRIARDLHDGLGIQLSRIKLFVEAHQEQLPNSVKEPLNQFLDEACTETRLVSSNLRPYTLTTFGLIPALEDLVQKLNLVNETRLILEHYGELPPLGDEASVMLYRVVQELLNNALKHAQAGQITVQIMANDETLLISVDDDGRGAEFPEVPTRGNGITNIKSRINYLGGQVMWQSEPQRGTSVMISLPIPRLLKTESIPE